MSVSDYQFAALLSAQMPATVQALQHLVMAMADYRKNVGKKSLFGKDKGAAAFQKLDRTLLQTLKGLDADGLVEAGATPDEYRKQLMIAVRGFERAFPNWQEAYGFAKTYFEGEQCEGIGHIRRLVSL